MDLRYSRGLPTPSSSLKNERKNVASPLSRSTCPHEQDQDKIQQSTVKISRNKLPHHVFNVPGLLHIKESIATSQVFFFGTMAPKRKQVPANDDNAAPSQYITEAKAISQKKLDVTNAAIQHKRARVGEKIVNKVNIYSYITKNNASSCTHISLKITLPHLL